MCFHGNQHPSSIKHSFISLYTKYQSYKFICFPIMNSPVFLSLDNIYCIKIFIHLSHLKSEKKDRAKWAKWATGNTPPTGTKENDISLHLKMIDQFWKQFQREPLPRFCYLLTLSWWDQYFGRSITSFVNHEIWNCKNLRLWCFDNKSSFSCQI